MSQSPREPGRWPLIGIVLIILILISPLLSVLSNGSTATSAVDNNGLAEAIQYLIFFGCFALAAVGIMVMTIHRDEHRPAIPADLGYQGWANWRTVGWALLALIGWLVIDLLSNICLNAAHLSTGQAHLIPGHSTLTSRWSIAILAIIIAPIFEELLFRGFAYRCLRSRFRVGLAAPIAGLLFGLAHFESWSTWPAVAVLAIDGTILCLLYERTRSLFPGMLIHGLNNTFAVNFEVHNALMQLGCAAGLVALVLITPIYLAKINRQLPVAATQP